MLRFGLGIYNPKVLAQPEMVHVEAPFYKKPIVLIGAGIAGLGMLFYLLSRKSKKGVDNATSS